MSPHTAKPPLIRPCTAVWLILLAFTAATFEVGEMGLAGPGAMAFVMVMAFVKGQMVADYFMGLKRVRLFWRALVFGYLLLICSLIGTAYMLGLNPA